MSKKKSRITLINVITNLLLQFFTVISGFIIPKLILKNFGSDVNGLISSITQFLSYISLLEGGVTGVIMTALYKPLINNDKEKISSICNTSKSFFQKISLIFIAYTLILSIIYPIIFNTKFSFIYIMTITWILSLGLLIQYMYSLSLKTLLNADKKIYIVSLTQIVIITLNVILTIIVVKVFPNIHLLKIISNLLFLIQPIIYSHYVKKYYDIDKKTKCDYQLLKNRWNGFAINLAAFIHFSTDLTILTIFTNLQTVSIYSIYALVTNGLRQIVQAITNSIKPTIGQAYAKNNIEILNEKMDLYEFVILIVVFYLFTLAGLLITPFVMIYTKGITDTNYYQPIFGYLIVIAEAIYLIKFPHLHLAYSANKYKEITPAAYIEALINIVISIPLVHKIGLIGVAIGTISAMTFRMIYHINYTSKLIKKRNSNKFYLKILIFIFATAIGIFLCKILVGTISYTIENWIYHSIIYSLIILFLYLIISIVFFKHEFKVLITYIKK